MSAKKYKLGAEIEAWCTKCKMDRLHAIETLKSDGNINRVICRTCEGSHLFRRPKGAGGGKTKAGGTKRRKKGEAALTEAEIAAARAYAMDGEYEVGEVIQHPKFGPGRVQTIKPGGKMEVGFEAAPKLLVCKDVGTIFTGKRGRAAPKAAPPPPPKPKPEAESEETESTDGEEE